MDRKSAEGRTRTGTVTALSLGNYLLLVEHTGRLLRQGKASITAELADIFERLGTTADAWQARVQRLRGGRLFGRFIASSREALRNVAQRLGVQRLANLCATRPS